ncbi:MAG: tetratricopeptide repeat protein [Candidatus Marinimicrobia bacterium]|nr:tetratricopeptide repeat protein [Candidatus Neomarinimicrobiota bacterium]MBL7059397.1 tetratricopeptide repeat protein [Candidatus Neomarinimicrobiota bacterium]
MKHQSILISAGMVILILNQTTFAREDVGLQNYRNQQFDQARKYYESVLEKQQNSSASFGLGASAFKQGDIETAIQAFDDVIRSEDNRLKAKSYYNMGNILHQQQRMDESLTFFKKALQLNPDDNDAKANYELLKYQRQQQEQNQQNQEDQEKSQDDKNDKNEQNQKQEDKEENSEKQEHSDQSKEQSDQSKEKKEHQEKQSDEKEDQKQQQEQSSEDQQKKDQQQTKSEESQVKKEEQKLEDKKNAEVILNALKQDEKINQKRKISKAVSKKLEKDW